jgi:superoxide oxidase
VQVFFGSELTSNEDLEQIAMIKNFETAEGLAVKAAAKSGRFDPTSIILHWLTVLLIVDQFTTAWLHDAFGHGTSLALATLATHRTMGALIWTVGLARLVWRRRFAHLPPFPESMPKLQRWIAKANILLLVQPITGLGYVLLRGRSFTLFIWQVPALSELDVAIQSLFQEAHEFLNLKKNSPAF